MNGYAGKILKLDLTERKVGVIPTSDYEQWGGGHGMGLAIFFDLVKDKTIDGFDPANVVTIMTSPLCGTLVPAAGGRTEVQGIGVQSLPIGWFTRSNFGGRFSAQLKYAGWDGLVIGGRADKPVWIDIRDEDVRLRDCAPLSLWGKDTWDCQQTIWGYVVGNDTYGDWLEPRGTGGGHTTQRPAVLTIGPAGENLSRLGCLIHDASNSSGQGGFGGGWGSKQLKAISVIGTGGIGIHDPKALLKARLWQKKNYAFNPDDPNISHGRFRTAPSPLTLYKRGGELRSGHRPQACLGCHAGCRGRYEGGLGNEACCSLTTVYPAAKTVDMLNRFGVNASEMIQDVGLLVRLNSSGAFGPGTGIECPLDFNDYGSLAFIEQLLKMIAYRNDGRGNPSQFGDDLAEGIVRAAKKWGRQSKQEGAEYIENVTLTMFPFWGLPINGKSLRCRGASTRLTSRSSRPDSTSYRAGIRRQDSPKEAHSRTWGWDMLPMNLRRMGNWEGSKIKFLMSGFSLYNLIKQNHRIKYDARKITAKNS